jgi:hypothetical protein
MASAFTPAVDAQGHSPKDAPSPEALAKEAQAELRGMLNRMLIDSLKAQETEAIEAAMHDPSALQRYKTLQKRRLQLETAQTSLQDA